MRFQIKDCVGSWCGLLDVINWPGSRQRVWHIHQRSRVGFRSYVHSPAEKTVDKHKMYALKVEHYNYINSAQQTDESESWINR